MAGSERAPGGAGRDAGPGAEPRRLGRGELLALDALAGVALTLLFLSLAPVQGPERVPAPVALGLAAAMGLPVAARRRWPVPVLGAVTVASVAAALLGVLAEPFLAVGYALYWVAVTSAEVRWLPTRVVGAASVALVVGALVAGTPTPAQQQLPVYVLGVALAGTAWTAGRAVRERRAYAARSARQLATRAVAEERLRIARELHDVVAHHIGVIAVKAGVANHVLPVRPEEAGDALRVIETASRGALAEMRQLLGVLRAEPAEPASLARLSGLVEHAAAAGVAVSLRGGLAGLSGPVERAAYRIVQEAVTNVIKHAAPTRCTVVLETADDGLTIEVTDEGAPGGAGRDGGTDPSAGPRGAGDPAPGGDPGSDAPGGSGGHGLVGMRERVARLGGELWTGRRPQGGFTVRARLPHSHPANPEPAPEARRAQPRKGEPTEDRRRAAQPPEPPAGGGAEPGAGPRAEQVVRGGGRVCGGGALRGRGGAEEGARE
ncbi:histidine kinase [Streptomyces sp. B6B3]|uniref:sensor histidine kinase n=1 Tax=Streptomyces sp. B6B3 TaxID=3153570 RepID=UPI00325E69EE